MCACACEKDTADITHLTSDATKHTSLVRKVLFGSNSNAGGGGWAVTVTVNHNFIRKSHPTGARLYSGGGGGGGGGGFPPKRGPVEQYFCCSTLQHYPLIWHKECICT